VIVVILLFTIKVAVGPVSLISKPNVGIFAPVAPVLSRRPTDIGPGIDTFALNVK
jgi:hypothetical protein